MRVRFNFFTIAALSLFSIAIAPASAETIAQSTMFGVAAPACAEQSQNALNRCAANWAKTADFLRTLIYEDIYAQLSAPMQSQLLEIEQSWNSYRDAHCQELSAPFQGGSIYPLLYHSCRARVANDRIADLQGQGYAQFSPDVTTQRLAKVLKLEKLQSSFGQSQWLRYQAHQCQFESLRFSEKSQQSKQCRDRLAGSRLRELESMIKAR